MDLGPGDFLARPFVCGALGDVRPEPLARLRQTVPGLVPVHETPDVLLLAAAPLPPYRADDQVRAWAFGDRSPVADCDWQAAAIEAETPGLADLGDRVVLHAGAIGLIDLFTRRLDGAIWFASRMEPLLDLDAAPLAVDWDAWAAIFMVTYPLGDATPFRAVRRLRPARAIVLDRATGRLSEERWSPPWHGLPGAAPDDGDPAAVIEAVRTAVGELGQGSHALSLSGGFDSRLLAIAARDIGVPVTAWTTAKDDSRDDAGIAVELAGLLGFPVRYVDAGAVPYAANGDEVRRRTEGSVAMHAWMGPLARALRSNGQPVITDVLGGAILGNAHLTDAIIAMAPGRDRLLALLASLEHPPESGRMLSESAFGWMSTATRDRWLESVAHLEGDPNDLILAKLETRIARGIGPMTMWLFGPELRVEQPLCRPDVLRAALSVGLRRKSDNRFYRELLTVADPRAGALRMTDDPGAMNFDLPILRASVDAMEWLRRDVEHARAVPGLVPDGLLHYLELGRWSGPGRWDRLLRRPPRPRTAAFGTYRMGSIAKQAVPIAMLGWWLDTNRHRLASLEPPWRARG